MKILPGTCLPVAFVRPMFIVQRPGPGMEIIDSPTVCDG